MTCQTCTAPTDSTYLCHRCAADLTSVLEQVPDALETVQDTVARLDRVGTGSGRGTERSRPPVNLDALEHQTHLTELVHSWARMVLESETRDDLRDVEPVTYLRISMHLIVAQDYAGEMHAELKDALRKVQRAADLPVERFAFGPCDNETEVGTCRERITCPPETVWHQCRACGAWHNIPVRMEAMRENVRGEPMPPRECIEYLAERAGYHVKLFDLKNWIKLGKLTDYALDHVGYGGERKLWRPGDVYRTAETMRARRRAA